MIDLVAAAATAADAASAAGFLAGEPDMFGLGGAQRVAIRSHCVVGEMFALPRFDVGAAGGSQQRRCCQ